ncbi:methyltransferase domain-containing protein [Clostridium sp. 19966]|nr:methyltransferase domain-containing protein [Clostridium sp. 19966]MDT8716438.1 methyltransferase domain-containing protein [Clostridium sp. 19966]
MIYLKEDNIKASVDENENAWNQENYEAWVRRFGTPKEAVEKIKKDPIKHLSVLYSKFGDVRGKKIINLMGSNGNKAVALALLGAEVTVVDFSHGNRQYAMELAKEAGVKIEYILEDVLKLNDDVLKGQYDIVFAEMGILHYFLDLEPFFNIAKLALKHDGIFILRDFHPVSTKLISSKGSTAKTRKHKVTGDYFDTTLQELNVAFSKYLDDKQEKQRVLIRRWNLGEIITAAAGAGFVIKSLEEEPNLSSEVFDRGIPKTFTLSAKNSY